MGKGTNIDFAKTSIGVVTGASRGIGREIALQLSNAMCKGSIIILIARSLAGLKETKEMMNEENVEIRYFVMDLEKDASALFEEHLTSIKSTFVNVENAIMFHNAGSVGIMDNLSSLSNPVEWQSFCNLNIVSVATLTPVFMRMMADKKIYLVNITSLIGRVAYKSLGMYGMAKIAREHYFSLLAIEEPSLAVLNYSPGPVDTSMFHDVLMHVKDDKLKSNFHDLKETNTVLTPTESVAAMMRILQSGEYENGGIVDFYQC